MMAPANPNDSQPSSLKRRLWRRWALLSGLWIVIALAYLIANWQEIYPKRPYYLLVPDETGAALSTWASTDEGASVQSFKRLHNLADAEELRVGENLLLLPKGLGQAQRQFFVEEAKAMRVTLQERHIRTIVYRFLPVLLLFVLGPPFALILLGRLAGWALGRWVGGP